MYIKSSALFMYIVVMKNFCFQQIWNHPGILQLTKEDRDYVRRGVAVENFLVDGSSSDENIDYNMVLEGIYYPFS